MKLFCCLLVLALCHAAEWQVATAFKLADEQIENIYKLNSLVNQENSIRVGSSSSSVDTLGQLKHLLQTRDIAHSIRLLEISNSPRTLSSSGGLVELIFPSSVYNSEATVSSIRPSEFKLEFLNLTGNNLTDVFLLPTNNSSSSSSKMLPHALVVCEYFSHVRVLKLTANKLEHLSSPHFDLFYNLNTNSSSLETLALDSNQLKSIKHNTFHRLTSLKYLDLSGNQLKLVHPLTFAVDKLVALSYVDLSANRLVAVFNFEIRLDVDDDDDETSSNLTRSSSLSSTSSIEQFYLNRNNDIKCDCGLEWLYELKQTRRVQLGGEFDCLNSDNRLVEFGSLTREELSAVCSPMPELIVNNQLLEDKSDTNLVRRASKAWFAHNFFPDDTPITTPAPYLAASSPHLKNDSNSNDTESVVVVEDKRTYDIWRLDDVAFECHNADNNSVIVWKTQYGYLSNMQLDEIKSFLEGPDDGNKSAINYKIFYHLNRVTKLSQNFTIKVSKWLASGTESRFYIDEKSRLVVTSLRMITAGPFACMAINEKGIRVYEYEIRVRTGVGENFIYSLIVSLVAMIIPSIAGIVVCCVCEYQVDKHYPQTPPCYPTPLTSTPPNFDFNEWLASAGSYLPNIHDTLEQVSKKLRKGMEKASVTVKSLSITSSAYIYSVYEQSSQRLSDMKTNMNVPNLSMPTMKYPPVGQLANRMRSGMGNMFIHFREFCGTSDLMHTTGSVADIESIDMTSQQVVGNSVVGGSDLVEQTYVIVDGGGAGGMNGSASDIISHTYYQRFLQMIRDEHNKRNKSKKTPIYTVPSKIVEADEEFDDSSDDDRYHDVMPVTPKSTTSSDSDRGGKTSSGIETQDEATAAGQQLPKIVLDEEKVNKFEPEDGPIAITTTIESKSGRSSGDQESVQQQDETTTV